MARLLLTLNNVFLLLCASMYLGTGGSLVFFSFPSAPSLHVDNYYLVLVPAAEAATEFFTTMTKLMLAAAAIMLVAEWKRGLQWVPLVVIGAVVAATALTIASIFPLNAELRSHIQDELRLQAVLAAWMHYNRIRVALWGVEWLAMAVFFGRSFFKLGRAL